MKTKQLPQGWKEVELGEIFILQDKTGKKAGEGSRQGRYKFFTSSSEQTKFINEYDFDGEYLIFATGGQAGIHYCNEKFSASNDCFVVKVDNRILTKYISYYLFSKIYLLEEGFKGAGLKHLSRNYLSSIKIIYPEEKEAQKQIVSILEKAERLKQKREEADKLTKEYLQSVFYEMFYNKNYEIKGFLDVFDITTGKLDSNAMEEDGKYPFFTCSQETYKINKFAFDCEALLLAGNNAAGVYSIKYYKGKFNAYQRTYVLTLKDKSHSFRYLQFLLEKKLEELKHKSLGTNTKYLTLGVLKEIGLIIPPSKEQQKFASIVEHVEKLKEKQKQSKEDIGNLFNSLMQKAFNGELAG